MGFAVGCSAKQSPAPTEQTESHIDSKMPLVEPVEKPPTVNNSFEPTVKAPPAPTAVPGDN